jgi:alkylation response protein AidB-like acyl-CoA dehydrogenase
VTTTAVSDDTALPGNGRELRLRVRGFLRDALAEGRFTPTVDTWMTGWDEDFSRLLGGNGFLGITIPVEYGGQGRTYLERFAVTEELLAAGAPIAAHWIADRQVAPALLLHGTEEQKRKYLPRIAVGECYFGIGMSEPEAGSDLAAVKTRADRVDGGWVLNGNKVWTSGAHHAEAFFVLARTESVQTGGRYGGLSQFIVDLRTPGVEIRAIYSSSGEHHFNEVFLTDVFVADGDVIGNIGEGWAQVTRELSFERSGPERFLSTFPLFSAALDTTAPDPHGLGHYVARYCALHQMSQQVSSLLQSGVPAGTAAAQVKLLGGTFEGDVVGWIDRLAHRSSRPTMAAPVLHMLDRALAQRPGFTLRGGTSEILRDIIAKGLTKDGAARIRLDLDVDPDLIKMIGGVMADAGHRLQGKRSDPDVLQEIWSQMGELGLARLTGSSASGGSEAGWAEAAVLLRAAAVNDVQLPFVEHDLLGGWLAQRAGLAAASECTTVAFGGLDGDARNVAWTGMCDRILVVSRDASGQVQIASASPPQLRFADEETSTLLGRDVEFDCTTLQFTTIDVEMAEELQLRGALARAVQMVGAIGWVVDSAISHVTERQQFGRSLSQFQAVRSLLAEVAAHAALAAAAVTAAIAIVNDGDITSKAVRAAAVAAAKSCTGHASEIVIRHGHQLHGAIGTTLEHSLHRYTNALLNWRNDFGSATYWDARLAKYATDGTSEELWQRITLTD